MYSIVLDLRINFEFPDSRFDNIRFFARLGSRHFLSGLQFTTNLWVSGRLISSKTRDGGLKVYIYNDIQYVVYTVNIDEPI